ncbi:hypothetical protein FIBSPDRAFT_967671 [Athelia psychrophila]|uniref:Uncharacterized protein n=1 Tax=Athelia psychrophila TaxID=1759441 RepID=A0A167VG34_9AGAM|nr:hypothetical protein FIBSPDRAFT_967671 [Fibularhizoctonia sp. CBS 109695]
MSLPMCPAKAPPILTILLTKKIEAHAQQFIQFTVDSNTGSTNIVEKIIFWYLIAPPPPPPPPPPPSPSVLNSTPITTPLALSMGNHFAHGTKVWWWDTLGQVRYGKVERTSRTVDGTQIIEIKVHNLEDVLLENLEVTLLDNIAVTLPVSSVNKM